MEQNKIPQENNTDITVKKDEYRPRYLQQVKIIQELTGSDETDILETAKKNYMSDWLLNFVTNYYGEKEEEILSPRKFRNLVRVRGVYSHYMKRRLAYSLPQIGRKIGNRDHTTILGVIRKTEERINNDPDFAKSLEFLWEKATKEFEEYVRKENKQINKKDAVISEFNTDTEI